MSRAEVVRILATDRLCEAGCVGRLTANERARWRRIRNSLRRRRWLCGRLATKYQLLSECGRGRLRAPSGSPVVEFLDPDSFDEFPASAYRDIEILPAGARDRGPPGIAWTRLPAPTYVSIAHTTGLSAVALSGSSAAGLDIETPACRLPSFVRQNFSLAERRWVAGLSRHPHLTGTKLYTLLWCLKEAALKSARSDEATILQIPTIGIRPLCSENTLTEALYPRTLGGPMEAIAVAIARDGRTRLGLAGVAAAAGAILVSLRIEGVT